jgi:hypothetical protein
MKKQCFSPHTRTEAQVGFGWVERREAGGAGHSRKPRTKVFKDNQFTKCISEGQEGKGR